ncbi:monocarboxylate transporter 13-like [Lingula anatina]|uniref:Monocarboxylate transporter 13-like n=1 Tax=Lingula anatina TaxID=7574 RepID=A0A1S3HX32_LINAN|nr:monocarboxylate transporter 13-like [Lingula anatina]XP_013389624.1 monocarboxylate transporter 13-like [Lingula anatina]XP_013389625.1 monocarboxylate transporter 13-like [Lingula anatina]XP_023929990.1 monocarboxylate transporter 13-like [Lingula anatina]|eukprot:XP_013389623.1 monocarboxylate transporter 13-like [Lingula anatina]
MVSDKCEDEDEAEAKVEPHPSISLPEMVLASSLTSLPHAVQSNTEQMRKTARDSSHCDDVDKGWAWVVMAAGSLSIFLTNGMSYSVGVMYLPMLETFKEGEATTSMVGSVFMGLSMLTGVFASILCDKFDCRKTCILGGFLFAAGMTCSTFGTSCTYLVITFGIIAGTGMTFAYTSVHICVSHYFNRRRPFALSALHTGGSIGQIVFGPLTHVFIDIYTWRGACLLLGAISLHLVVAGALLRPHRNEYLHKERKRASILDFGLFKNIPFDLFLATVLFMCVAFGMVYLHFPAYSVYNGTSEHMAAMLLSVIGITSMCLKLLVGGAMSHDSVDIWTVFTICNTITGLLTVFSPAFMKGFSGQLAFAVLFGMYTAPFVICTNSLAALYAETSQLGFAMGLLAFASGIGLFVGPVIAGVVYGRTASYAPAVQLAGSCLLANTVLMFLAAIFSQLRASKKDLQSPESNMDAEDEQT